MTTLPGIQLIVCAAGNTCCVEACLCCCQMGSNHSMERRG